MQIHDDAPLKDVLDGYVRDTFTANPIAATKLGVHEHDAELGNVSADAFQASEQRHRDFVRDLERFDPDQLSGLERLDWQTGIIEGRSAVRKDLQEVWRRAPYLYSESLGDALSVLMTRDHAPVEERAAALCRRLDGIPAYLASARTNLTEQTPALWAETGLTSTTGLERFLTNSVPAFGAQVDGALGSEIAEKSRKAAAGVAEYRSFVEELAGRAAGNWASGSEHFDFMLQSYHLLDLDHRTLEELGRDTVAADSKALAEFAASLDPELSWQEQVSRIKDNHPQPAEFKDSYFHELQRARKHTQDAALATLPEGEICTMEWVPEFMRASLPIAVMSTTPPFERGLASEWLITPSDPAAPAAQRLEQMRDNCYVFAESIAGHEIYPGHHLQKVHHKLATKDSAIRRYFSCPQFVEGWGLYVEDLFEETGFFDNPAVILFKLRNSLWRALRVVIDVGLHTGSLTFEQAVDLLRTEAAMDRHMAEGEVRRYTRHDNPTYPSSYLLGRLAIHDLRTAYQERRGDTFTLLDFHDTLLGFGSLPLKLVAEQMLPAGVGGNLSA
ncbi:MAG: DUF885 domain-containing protein [Nakamurella sp.]